MKKVIFNYRIKVYFVGPLMPSGPYWSGPPYKAIVPYAVGYCHVVHCPCCCHGYTSHFDSFHRRPLLPFFSRPPLMSIETCRSLTTTAHRWGITLPQKHDRHLHSNYLPSFSSPSSFCLLPYSILSTLFSYPPPPSY